MPTGTVDENDGCNCNIGHVFHVRCSFLGNEYAGKDQTGHSKKYDTFGDVRRSAATTSQNILFFQCFFDNWHVSNHAGKIVKPRHTARSLSVLNVN